MKKQLKPNPNNEIRAASYIRVSTEEQAENPEGSIKNQEERLNYTIQMKTTDLQPWVKVGAYIDAGRSGKDMNRSELKRLLKDIEAGHINMLMVSELSRLTRSNKDFSELWEFLQAHKCGFFSLRENFDTSTAAGEMMLYQIANFAQFERKQTSERVSANFESRAKRGLWNGGVLPMGYEPDPDHRGSLRIVEEEAKTVRAAFAAILQEGSVTRAAKWLNQNNYSYGTALRGGGFRARNKHFIFDSLYRLISNKAYIGVRVVRTKKGTTECKAIWPAIIDEKTFQDAQKILETGRKQKVGRWQRYPYLLSTRIHCEDCGQGLIGKSAYSGSGKKVGYYEHGNQIKQEHTLETKSHRCTPFRVPAAKIEARAWKEILNFLTGDREPLFQELKKLGSGNDRQRTQTHQKMELESYQAKIKILAQRIANLPEGVPIEPIYDEMKLLNENKSNLLSAIQNEKLEHQKDEIVSENRLTKFLDHLKSKIPDDHDLNPDLKRKILHALVGQIIVTQDGLKLGIYAGLDQIKKGEAKASPDLLPNFRNYFVPSSFKHLNGGRTRD